MRSTTTATTAAAEPRRRRIFRSLALVDPGIVVAGSVMGSGELINTPVQAARFGFVLLWAVVLSCVIKFFLQVEIARHALVHNRTTFEALNHCPGPKWRGTNWIGLLYIAGYVIVICSVSSGWLPHRSTRTDGPAVRRGVDRQRIDHPGLRPHWPVDLTAISDRPPTFRFPVVVRRPVRAGSARVGSLG